MYLKSKDNVITDTHSCVSPLEWEAVDRDDFDEIPVHHITPEVSATEFQWERVRMSMQADPVLSQLQHQIFMGWPDVRSIPENINPLWNYRNELVIEDGLIFKAHKLVIPASQQTWIHPGLVCLSFRWEDPTQNLRMHILARHYRGHQRIHQGMQHMPVNETKPTKGASHPTWHTEWTMGDTWDWHLPIWVSWILTGSRLFQQFLLIRVLNNPMATHVINILKMMFSEYGIPAHVFMDQGRQFISTEFWEFAKCNRFKVLHSTLRYPESNGFIE